MRNRPQEHTVPGKNIRMTVEYDGTRYVGWQRQRNGLSVQEVVENALRAHLHEEIRVTAAGRTDSGVHALGQVINFHTASHLQPRAILKGALPHLPPDVALIDSSEVPPDFNARRGARLRWYKYFICNRSTSPPAVAHNYLTFVPFRLDIEVMRDVARVLAGAHDFRAFRSVNCTAKRTLLDMHEPGITRLPDGILLLDFRCQSFLQNMVRIMAGVIVACGRGKMRVADVQRMLETGERANDAITLPPNGLFLYRVFYMDQELQDVSVAAAE